MKVNNAFRRVWNALAWAHAEIEAIDSQWWSVYPDNVRIELRDGGYCAVVRRDVCRPDLR